MTSRKSNKYIVSCLSPKGGCGKTTTSHMISTGLAKLGFAVTHVSNDTSLGRNVRSSDPRPYTTYQAKTDEDRAAFLTDFANYEVPEDRIVFAVFDGAGSHHHVDKFLFDTLSEDIHLILVPFAPSEEDTDVLKAMLDHYPSAIGVPTMWTNNKLGRDALEREIFEDYLANYHHRIAKDDDGDFFIVERNLAFRALLSEKYDLSDHVSSFCKKYVKRLVLPHFGIAHEVVEVQQQAIRRWRRRQANNS